MYSIKNYAADGVDSMNLVEGERVFVIGKTQSYMPIPKIPDIPQIPHL
jgi:hypothetical protein